MLSVIRFKTCLLMHIVGIFVYPGNSKNFQAWPVGFGRQSAAVKIDVNVVCYNCVKVRLHCALVSLLEIV